MLFTPLMFVALDFWSGIRKSRKRGIQIYSDKMKHTVNKIARYYNAILAMMVVDSIQICAFIFLWRFNDWSLYTFPAFTLVAVCFVAAIEIKSICEPADAKERKELKEVTELAQAIANHKNDPKQLAKDIANYLRDDTEK